MAKREPRIRGWMKRNNIEDYRFRVEWVSAGEGKKWQGIMTEMAEVVTHLEDVKLLKKPVKKTTKPKAKKGAKKTTKSKKPATRKKKTKKQEGQK
jgi:hypothetical protein